MRITPVALVLLLAGAVLAGCSSPPADDKTILPPPPPPPLYPVFTTPTKVGTGGEPGLLLTNGTIWAHAPGHMWRSEDKGANWTAVDPGPALGVFGNDAEMVQDSTGRIYYSDLQLTATLAVYSSGDNGKTWDYHPIASMSPAVDRQWMATGPDAGPLKGSAPAVYLAFNQLTSSPWVMKSTDGGKTWLGHIVDPTQDPGRFWSIGNLVADNRTGQLFLTWVVGSAAHGIGPEPPVVDWKIRMATSTDGGLTWTAHDIYDPAGNPGHLFAVLAEDSAGRLYTTWSQDVGDHEEIMLMSSADQGTTWTAPVKVNQHNGTAVQPWIAAGAAGHVAVVWYGNNQTKLSDDASGDWFVYMAQSMDANATTPHFTESKVYEDAIRTGPICTVGIACDPTSDARDLLDFFEVKLDAKGNANVIFADTNHKGIFFARQVDGPTL
ncbi:MAG: glycoside hydrolase [Halobacteriales archaeon]|nr:glycoside hydrolase [Halobacteriales archaeon]